MSRYNKTPKVQSEVNAEVPKLKNNVNGEMPKVQRDISRAYQKQITGGEGQACLQNGV